MRRQVQGTGRIAVALVTLCVLAACTGDGDNERGAATPLDPGDLQGSEWVLVTTGDGDGVPAPLTLDIGDGSASGSGPCNVYNVRFEYDGHDLTTGRVMSTAIGCARRLARAEERYFRAIAAADTIEKESGRLELSGSDGDDRLVFARAGLAERITGDWDVVNVGTTVGIGSVVPGLDGRKPTLTFHSDGTLAIDTGCNTGTASWTPDGRSLRIEAPQLTKMSCSDAPGVMAQEQSIVDALERTRTAEIAGTQAMLMDGDGLIVLVLARDP